VLFLTFYTFINYKSYYLLLYKYYIPRIYLKEFILYSLLTFYILLSSKPYYLILYKYYIPRSYLKEYILYSLTYILVLKSKYYLPLLLIYNLAIKVAR